jgi:hypothetical protein
MENFQQAQAFKLIAEKFRDLFDRVSQLEAAPTPVGGGGGGGTANAQYLTLAVDAALTQERVLNVTGGATTLDNGAGSTYDVDVHDAVTLGGGNYAALSLAGQVLTLSQAQLSLDYIDEGQAAGGDLGGTYPDPTVTWGNGTATYDTQYLKLDCSNDPLTGALVIQGNVTIGAGAAGVDYTLTFDGEDNDGVITWLEDEDTFDMSCRLRVRATTDYLEFYHDESDGYLTWTDGQLVLITDEGANTNTDVVIRGKGTGYGDLYIEDQDGAESLRLTAAGGIGFVEVVGTTINGLELQQPADTNIYAFSGATEGDTPELYIYGYRTGDAKRSLQIGVGVDADDTVSFDGLGTYWFDGIVQAVSGVTIDAFGTAGFVKNDASGVLSGGNTIGGADLTRTFTTKTADYTATSSDDIILVDTSLAAVTITLPAVASSTGVELTIKCIDATNACTVDGNGAETIDEQATQALALYDSITVVCDGVEWWIV